jgi:hypothetical protein
MPVAIPKTERHIMNAVITNITVLAKGGSSGEVFGNLLSENPRNAMEVLRRKSKLARRATTAAAMTEAEALEKFAIACLYTIPGRSREGTRRRKHEEKDSGSTSGYRVYQDLARNLILFVDLPPAPNLR